jgi:hypothetical protein
MKIVQLATQLSFSLMILEAVLARILIDITRVLMSHQKTMRDSQKT